jgi:hypothetical protein
MENENKELNEELKSMQEVYDNYSAEFNIDGMEYILWNECGSVDLLRVQECEGGELHVPEYVEYEGKEYPVTCICPECFLNAKIKKIYVPKTVKRIDTIIWGDVELVIDKDNENYCLENGTLYNKDKSTILRCMPSCKGEFVIPDTVDTIDGSAFGGCGELTSIVIPDSVKQIEGCAFSNCDKIESVTLGRNVSCISTSTFRYFNGKIFISEDNPHYSYINGCLYDKDNKTLMSVNRSISGEYEIPEGTLKVLRDAFERCYDIRRLIIPKSLQLCPYSFAGLNQLDDIEIKEGNENYVLVDGVMYSKDMECAVKATTAVKEYTVPDKVIYISDGAFNSCYNLSKVVFPHDMEEIGDRAFDDCFELKDVYVHFKDIVDWDLEDEIYFVPDIYDTCILHVPHGDKEKYQYTNQWSYFENIVDDL